MDNDLWYILTVGAAGKQQVEVLYVDYGNTATIHYTQLKKMTDDFLKLYRLVRYFPFHPLPTGTGSFLC